MLPIPVCPKHLQELVGATSLRFRESTKCLNFVAVRPSFFLLGINLCALRCFYPLPLVPEISFPHPSPRFFSSKTAHTHGGVYIPHEVHLITPDLGLPCKGPQEDHWETRSCLTTQRNYQHSFKSSKAPRFLPLLLPKRSLLLKTSLDACLI